MGTDPKPYADSPAAVFIRRQTELPAYKKSQREIAHEAGFANSNLISMFKTGALKVPLDRVPSLAHALEVDPAYLMQLALEQAVGKTASVVLLEVFGPLTTVDEKA